MIAVSSFRPLGQSAAFDKNQLAAKQSWDQVFEEVIYLNEREAKLENATTFFLENKEHPTIREMCRVCAQCPRWSCIINADIVVSPKLIEVEVQANRHDAWALTSYRYQPRNGTMAVIDNGLDFFAARPWVWKWAYEAVPAQLRIGHPTWDTWMIGFFNAHAPGKFYNITKSKCIFHPIHEDRRHVFNVDGALENLRTYCGMPAPTL